MKIKGNCWMRYGITRYTEQFIFLNDNRIKTTFSWARNFIGDFASWQRPSLLWECNTAKNQEILPHSMSSCRLFTLIPFVILCYTRSVLLNLGNGKKPRSFFYNGKGHLTESRWKLREKHYCFYNDIISCWKLLHQSLHVFLHSQTCVCVC